MAKEAGKGTLLINLSLPPKLAQCSYSPRDSKRRGSQITLSYDRPYDDAAPGFRVGWVNKLGVVVDFSWLIWPKTLTQDMI